MVAPSDDGFGEAAPGGSDAPIRMFMGSMISFPSSNGRRFGSSGVPSPPSSLPILMREVKSCDGKTVQSEFVDLERISEKEGGRARARPRRGSDFERLRG
jgi:hypothetical protein